LRRFDIGPHVASMSRSAQQRTLRLGQALVSIVARRK
jgi:hypothetical protein